jgi:ubiquinone/menaquinone biosynthesis C-methylase UbiE
VGYKKQQTAVAKVVKGGPSMNHSKHKNGYSKERQWNPYACLFSTITASVQLEVYYDAASHLFGNVADFGCGTAKIAPLLLNQNGVTSYTGIDFSEEMVNIGNKLIGEICPQNYQLVQGSIESVSDRFSSGVSIQSYYSWPDPEKPLRRIYETLHTGATFVLATVNDRLDIVEVLKKIEREQIGHPDISQYKKYNMSLANNRSINVIKLGDLVQQALTVGFDLIEAHQRYFLGGLNFLVLKKQ